MEKTQRIVFLDYLRVIACFMVMVIHACEPFYLGGEQGTYIATRGDAFWVTLVECLCRACVPLFVMASSYLLFPVTKPTGVFFRRRLVRVFIPFLLWACIYVWRCNGNWTALLFNFPDAGGHLWFVPMILGVYLVMPLLSPWAEKVSERELRGWLLLWLLTTTFPFLRRIWSMLLGTPPFGAVPYLYGECPWNMFGTFHYVSGFLGYMLLGFWFRKFAPTLTWRKTLAVATPLWLVGVAIIGILFFFRIPEPFPYSAPYAKAVDLEMSIEYCSLGVALTVIASFLILRKINWDNGIYRRIILPVSAASYGMYLVHILILTPVFETVRPHVNTPSAILLTATATYIGSAIVILVLRKIPKIGTWLAG
ncbi:MAG: acyltransferase family protein [Kiritimatiellae bacterium]|nr:acyltransferase family protein [Kiritimatiellia bacterium]